MNFYRMMAAGKRSAICIDAEIPYDDMELFHNPMVIIDNNHTFKVYKGTKPYDIVQLCDPVNLAISERMKNVLMSNNISGWSYYPIKIKDIQQTYFGFHVSGKAGPVTNLDEDGFIPIENIEFNINTWDGSDIFNLLDSGGIKVCTERVKEILEKEKIENLKLEPL